MLYRFLPASIEHILAHEFRHLYHYLFFLETLSCCSIIETRDGEPAPLESPNLSRIELHTYFCECYESRVITFERLDKGSFSSDRLDSVESMTAVLASCTNIIILYFMQCVIYALKLILHLCSEKLF